ncbi:hypothetical protein S83_009713, partial [Arachis hypogaea]
MGLLGGLVLRVVLPTLFNCFEGTVDTFLDYDNLSKRIVFTTDRPYQPGEQEKLELLKKYGLSGSQCFPIQITGWPLELMAYAYLAVSPPSMITRSEEMAVVASNKSTAKKDSRYPEIEEQALCESNAIGEWLMPLNERSVLSFYKILRGDAGKVERVSAGEGEEDEDGGDEDGGPVARKCTLGFERERHEQHTEKSREGGVTEFRGNGSSVQWRFDAMA